MFSNQCKHITFSQVSKFHLHCPDHLRKMYHDEISDWLQAVRDKGEKSEITGSELIQSWEEDPN